MITLIRRPGGDTTGIGIYSEVVSKVSEDRREVHPDIDLKEGLGNLILNGFIRPVLETMEYTRGATACHATDEMCGFLLPFSKTKKIVTIHHISKDKWNSKSSMVDMFWRFSTWMSVRSADIILTPSQQTKDDIIEKYGTPDEKITVVPTPIRSIFRTIPDVERHMVLGCVSTFNPRKNVAAAIRSFKRVTGMPGTEDARMRICGKGKEKDILIALVNELDLQDKVEFIQDLSDEEMAEFYNSISVLANPSLHEGQGYVTLEAQSCSVPVVYFKDAEIPEEVTRYAVPSSDEDDFAKNIHRLMTDPEFREATVYDAKEYATSFKADFKEKMKDIYGLSKDLG